MWKSSLVITRENLSGTAKCLRSYLSSSCVRRNAVKATTIDSKELKKFNEVVTWWNGESLRVLRTFNKIRVPFVTRSLIQSGKLDATAETSTKPLQGIKMLDMGCGGGIATEEFAKLGAEITGLDAAENAIQIAKEHMVDLDPSVKLTYINSTVEKFAAENRDKFDVVFSSEVIEHVSNAGDFANKCIACAKPGGSVIFTTVSRSVLSKIYMIWFSEYLTGTIPLGMHEYSKFITPDELGKIFMDNNCKTKNTEGYIFSPFTKEWFFIPTTKLCYGMHAIKD